MGRGCRGHNNLLLLLKMLLLKLLLLLLQLLPGEQGNMSVGRRGRGYNIDRLNSFDGLRLENAGGRFLKDFGCVLFRLAAAPRLEFAGPRK